MTTKLSDRIYIVAASKPFYRKIFRTPVSTSDDQWRWVETCEQLDKAIAEENNIRYVFFLHWNWRVDEHIWANYECVCFHMTDVPYGRGGSPLQNLILNGHRKTKLTALRMVREMDAGPVYAKRDLTLEGTAEEIYLRAGRLSLEILNWMVQEEPEPTNQDGDPVYFRRRRPEESALPSEGSFESLYDFIRMLDAPTYPKAFLHHGAFRIEFDSAELHGEAVDACVRITKLARNEK